MPTTATIAAMPMAMPSAVSIVRTRELRSPIDADARSAGEAQLRRADRVQARLRRALTALGGPVVDDPPSSSDTWRGAWRRCRGRG